jgi:hypothetical protein
MATLVVAAGATAEVITNRTPFTASFFNPCTGETFVAEGFIETHAKLVVGSDGRLHEQFHQNLKGMTAKGVVTGAKYVVQQEWNEGTNADADAAPSTQHHIFKEHYVRTGENGALIDDDDFLIYFRIHMTINAQGMPTSLKIDTEEDPCR